jgi:AcrR family transcriptional regulator
MQILKDEVKNNIIEAAVKEFSLLGYEKASMRNIAKAAGISVSNTYNYYHNKNQLFESIIEPVFSRLKDILKQSFQQSMKSGAGNNLQSFIDGMVKPLIQLDARQRQLLVILVEKSAGTKYEKSRDEMVNLLRMHLAEATRKPGNAMLTEETPAYILSIIADNYINGLFRILKDFRSPEWAEANMRTLLTYHLNGIKALVM